MNKPVAWITPDNLKILENEYGEEVLVRNQDHYTYEIPLYTHPVKELTDEEILQQAEWMFGTYFFESIDDPYWIEFARAILRKAQEK